MDRNPDRETRSQAWDSTRGGDAAACSFVRHLLALGRSQRIYQEGHGRVHENASALRSVADELLHGRADDLDFVVDGASIRFAGEPLRSEPAVAASFAEVLRARGIRALVLRAGLERSELLNLAELIGGDAKELHREGGVTAALEDMFHPHFDLIETGAVFRGVTGDAGDEEPDEPALISTDPAQLVTNQSEFF